MYSMQNILAENLQKTGSFKCRGALNAISMLDPAVSSVCCYSSGNHGQGSAWAAKQNDKVCHVAVPHDTPEVKLDAIKNYGGVVHFSPTNDTHGRGKFRYLRMLKLSSGLLWKYIFRNMCSARYRVQVGNDSYNSRSTSYSRTRDRCIGNAFSSSRQIGRDRTTRWWWRFNFWMLHSNKGHMPRG